MLLFGTGGLDLILVAIGAVLMQVLRVTVEDAVEDGTASQITPNGVANLVQWNIQNESAGSADTSAQDDKGRVATDPGVVSYSDVNLGEVLRLDATVDSSDQNNPFPDGVDVGGIVVESA